MVSERVAGEETLTIQMLVFIIGMLKQGIINEDKLYPKRNDLDSHGK